MGNKIGTIEKLAELTMSDGEDCMGIFEKHTKMCSTHKFKQEAERAKCFKVVAQDFAECHDNQNPLQGIMKDLDLDSLNELVVQGHELTEKAEKMLQGLDMMLAKGFQAEKLGEKFMGEAMQDGKKLEKDLFKSKEYKDFAEKEKKLQKNSVETMDSFEKWGKKEYKELMNKEEKNLEKEEKEFEEGMKKVPDQKKSIFDFLPKKKEDEDQAEKPESVIDEVKEAVEEVEDIFGEKKKKVVEEDGVEEPEKPMSKGGFLKPTAPKSIFDMYPDAKKPHAVPKKKIEMKKEEKKHVDAFDIFGNAEEEDDVPKKPVEPEEPKEPTKPEKKDESIDIFADMFLI